MYVVGPTYVYVPLFLRVKTKEAYPYIDTEVFTFEEISVQKGFGAIIPAKLTSFLGFLLN